MTGPYIQVRGNRTISLLSPVPDDYVLSDVAYALAHLNRYTGHLGAYSVAQHSVLGAERLADEGRDLAVIRAFVTHDFLESVIGDISNPMKKAIRELFRGAMRDLLEGIEQYTDEPFRAVEWAGYPSIEEWPDAVLRLDRIHGEVVASRFSTAWPLPEATIACDLKMCVTEATQGFGSLIGDGWPKAKPYEGMKIVPWNDPMRAERELLRVCERFDVR